MFSILLQKVQLDDKDDPVGIDFNYLNPILFQGFILSEQFRTIRPEIRERMDKPTESWNITY